MSKALVTSSLRHARIKAEARYAEAVRSAAAVRDADLWLLDQGFGLDSHALQASHKAGVINVYLYSKDYDDAFILRLRKALKKAPFKSSLTFYADEEDFEGVSTR